MDAPTPSNAPPPGGGRPPLKRSIRFLFTVLVLGGALVAWLVSRAQRATLQPLDGAAVHAATQAASALPPLEAPGGFHALRGVVRDGAGAPVAEALVGLRAGGRPYWTYSDTDGRYQLRELPAGAHEVVVVAPPHPVLFATFEVPTENDADLDLPPDPPPLEVLPEVARSDVALTVRAAGGSTAAGCQVVLAPAPGSEPLAGVVPRRAEVDADGGAVLAEVAHGAYELLVLPPLDVAGVGPALVRQDLVLEGPVDGLSVSLRCGAIAGVLVDAEGRPVEGAAVLAHAEADPDAVRAVISDEGGAFRLEHLVPGSWRVRIRAGTLDTERVVPVSAGRLQPLDLGPLVGTDG